MNRLASLPVLAPFRVRSFRFQWPADLLTSWAFEMETLILGWYVLSESDSVILLTVFGALTYIGTLVAPVFGMLGDRLGRRTMICCMRAYYASLATAVVILGLTGHLTPYLVLGIAFFTGLVRQSDLVMRNSLLGDTMPSDRLLNAVGLARMTQDTARIAGALAGAGIFAALGMGPAYIFVAAFYGASFLFSLGVAQSRRIVAAAGEPQPSRWRDLKDGFVYIWNTPRLLALMWLAFLINLSAFPFTTGLLPFVARSVYGVDETGLGTIMAGYASGAFVGSMAMAVTGGARSPVTFMFANVLLWYALLAVFATLDTIALGFPLIVVIGVVQALAMLSMTGMILGTAEADLRGRVMGVRMLAVYGLSLGLPVAGGLIKWVGYEATVWLYAAVGIGATIAIALKWRRALWI